ncbi:hypothetical protein H072_7108 [Dactylellina haptotyla CBS 200.50]|uniref:Stress-response A/B barrel domain-containing protein n=1 Tax=Dactylellina haptotyla (strain CBS 200.50) TaxID=1284197 RepID=S8BUY2_DACHA|nr:hypothetical protein H072_7108 [Dactylellina haptotyla CBS 200.50]
MIGRGPIFLLFFAVLLLVSFSLLYNTHFTIPTIQNHSPAPGGGAIVPAMSTIVHIVLLKFTPGTPSDGVKPLCDAFIKLKETCIHPETQKPYIISVKGGLDNSIENLTQGYTHAFVLEFASIWDRDYYVDKDPQHQIFKGLLKAGGLDSVTVVDFANGTY